MTKLILLSLFTLLSASAHATPRMKGVIREMECNNPSGLGIVQLERRQGSKIVVTSVKVNSRELCSSAPTGGFSQLGSIAYDAIFLGKLAIHTLEIENGFAKRIIKSEEIKSEKFYRGVSGYTYVDQREAEAWFFRGPAQLHLTDANLEERIAEYTSN